MTASAIGNPEPCLAADAGCPGRILFLVHTATGNPAPIDAVPDPAGGNLRVDLRRGTYTGPLTGTTLTEARAGDEQLHVSHFATCTRPDLFRYRARTTRRPRGGRR